MNQVNNNTSYSIFGRVKPSFKPVETAFAENFQLYQEIGAAVAVYHEGDLVVDLWGGFKDQARTQDWKQDTLVCMMSTTKAVASLAVLWLVDRGLLELEKPIANYWPEFAQAGKDTISVQHLLAQLAGLPTIDHAPRDSYYDIDLIEKALAKQAPRWKPGTQPCYHSFTYGPLCQILIKKVTGKTLGSLLREDILGPLNIDFFIGVQEPDLERCADIILDPNIPSLTQMKTLGTLLEEAWRPLPMKDNFFQEKQFRVNELASANGHGNARELAFLYNLLCEDLLNNTQHLLNQETIKTAVTEQWNAVEAMTNRPFRYATGFMLSNPHFYIGSDRNGFGHPGMGGPIAFAAPSKKFSFSYCCNRIRAIDNTGQCASNLIDAVYQCIDA